MDGTAATDDALLTPQELVARWTSKEGTPAVTLGTLANWRCKGRGPRFFKPGGTHGARVLYPLKEIEKWERQHRFGGNGESPEP